MRLRIVAVGLVGLSLVGIALVARAMTRVGVHQGYAPAQPIAFPHKVHAGDHQIACLYCHSGARTSRHAGIPSASVCMNCHNLLEKQTRDLQILREAVQVRRPIAWVKVHNLPDFVYFNHSQHVRKGVACADCHGPVASMDRVEQVSPLTMGWCLSCHRAHAGVPRESLWRVAANLKAPSQPAPPGLDCVSCHY